MSQPVGEVLSRTHNQRKLLDRAAISAMYQSYVATFKEINNSPHNFLIGFLKHLIEIQSRPITQKEPGEMIKVML